LLALKDAVFQFFAGVFDDRVRVHWRHNGGHYTCVTQPVVKRKMHWYGSFS
jgi:hypothetical protein